MRMGPTKGGGKSGGMGVQRRKKDKSLFGVVTGRVLPKTYAESVLQLAAAPDSALAARSWGRRTAKFASNGRRLARREPGWPPAKVLVTYRSSEP
ncbi:hypothetical protein GGTG_09344 [Gaeumannomyces tritici R3-111a-1]|uniref:Uncharacterized protein n=1 Tax=Gaeumannomyces tritici (strain R3-111a-1) TaxID=644352 RepID=J3P747_GAET3|nr:hypothetical protein GGTG_09344 [Gaeumannomyces tritici R3-111a-1]EJT72478.1 hypothetical protein GGTG_09344 [Gaeumannomyces tritici R3-111a-1]